MSPYVTRAWVDIIVAGSAAAARRASPHGRLARLMALYSVASDLLRADPGQTGRVKRADLVDAAGFLLAEINRLDVAAAAPVASKRGAA